jgi:hypothetical protein
MLLMSKTEFAQLQADSARTKEVQKAMTSVRGTCSAAIDRIGLSRLVEGRLYSRKEIREIND